MRLKARRAIPESDYLSKEFGHVKKAPDDHPILKAIQSIEAIIYVFGTVEEDEDEEEAGA